MDNKFLVYFSVCQYNLRDYRRLNKRSTFLKETLLISYLYHTFLHFDNYVRQLLFQFEDLYQFLLLKGIFLKTSLDILFLNLLQHNCKIRISYILNIQQNLPTHARIFFDSRLILQLYLIVL